MENLLYFETHVKEKNDQWIVLVHGAGGSIKTWKRQVEQLGADYNLLIVDLPGHGKSGALLATVPIYSFEFVAEKIWEVVDHLNIPAVHLVGISLGTVICLQMRILHPDRVRSVVMPGAIVQLNFKLRTLASMSLALAKIIGYPNFYKLSAYVMMPRGNHKKSRDVFVQESKALTMEEFKKWTDLYYHLNKTLNVFFHAASKIPHILIMGSQDHLFIRPAQAYADKHANASISVLDNCGHVVSIEKAALFNKICLTFLNGLSKGVGKK